MGGRSGPNNARRAPNKNNLSAGLSQAKRCVCANSARVLTTVGLGPWRRCLPGSGVLCAVVEAMRRNSRLPLGTHETLAKACTECTAQPTSKGQRGYCSPFPLPEQGGPTQPMGAFILNALAFNLSSNPRSSASYPNPAASLPFHLYSAG